MTQKRLVVKKEFARLLGVSVRTVERWTKAKQVKTRRIAPRARALYVVPAWVPDGGVT